MYVTTVRINMGTRRVNATTIDDWNDETTVSGSFCSDLGEDTEHEVAETPVKDYVCFIDGFQAASEEGLRKVSGMFAFL